MGQIALGVQYVEIHPPVRRDAAARQLAAIYLYRGVGVINPCFFPQAPRQRHLRFYRHLGGPGGDDLLCFHIFTNPLHFHIVPSYRSCPWLCGGGGEYALLILDKKVLTEYNESKRSFIF